MRFWPFGKDKDETPAVEFGSRVVTGAARDGRHARAKLTVAFASALPQESAEGLIENAAKALRAAFEAAEVADDLVASETSLAATVTEQIGAPQAVRAVEIVALHIVGESASEAAPATRRPLSEPPPRGFAAATRSATPAAPRRASSSQMLAVRDSRLIPEGASPEAVAYAIVPLLRDAGTRVLVGILRAYDLLVVRAVEVTSASVDDFGELVPVSQAAPGRFADERRSELARWEEHFGKDKLAALRNESSAVVCLFLHTSLARAGLGTTTAVALLEAAAQLAFPNEGAVAAIPRYLGAPDAAEALASRALDTVTADRAVLAGFALAMTPVLASLQDDFTFTATQIKLSGIDEAPAPT